MLNPRAFTFGGTSAVVTSMGLVIGLESATAPPPTIVSGLLIIAVADNVSDSLSIHMYQEAERLDTRGALRTTLANFVTRLLVAVSFVIMVMMKRGVSALGEIGKHIAIAVTVIIASRLIGTWILHHVSTSTALG